MKLVVALCVLFLAWTSAGEDLCSSEIQTVLNIVGRFQKVEKNPYDTFFAITSSILDTYMKGSAEEKEMLDNIFSTHNFVDEISDAAENLDNQRRRAVDDKKATPTPPLLFQTVTEIDDTACESWRGVFIRAFKNVMSAAYSGVAPSPQLASVLTNLIVNPPDMRTASQKQAWTEAIEREQREPFVERSIVVESGYSDQWVNQWIMTYCPALPAQVSSTVTPTEPYPSSYNYSTNKNANAANSDGILGQSWIESMLTDIRTNSHSGDGHPCAGRYPPYLIGTQIDQYSFLWQTACDSHFVCLSCGQVDTPNNNNCDAAGLCCDDSSEQWHEVPLANTQRLWYTEECDYGLRNHTREACAQFFQNRDWVARAACESYADAIYDYTHSQYTPTFYSNPAPEWFPYYNATALSDTETLYNQKWWCGLFEPAAWIADSDYGNCNLYAVNGCAVRFGDPYDHLLEYVNITQASDYWQESTYQNQNDGWPWGGVWSINGNHHGGYGGHHG